MNFITEQLYFILGAILVLIYILSPFLYSYFKTPENSVWVPINHQNKLPGDNRFYAAGVRSALDSFIKYKHPCSETIGPMGIDLTRYISYRIAAILTLGINDLRFAYLVSYTLSILLQYTLIFVITNILTSDGLFSLVISLVVLLFYNYVYELIRYSFSVISHPNNYYLAIIGRSGNTILFNNNDQLRYVILSVSGLYIWISFLVVLLINPLEYFLLYMLSTMIISLSALMVYPSIFIISTATLFINLIPIFIGNIYLSLYFFGGSVIVLSLIILVFYRIFEDSVQKVKNLNLSDMHSANAKVNNIGINEYIFLLLNLIFLLYVLFNPLHIFSGIFIILLISVIIFTISSKLAFVKRLFDRGGMHIYLFLLLITIHFSIQPIIPLILELIYWIILFLVSIIILISAKNNSRFLYGESSFYITQAEWETISYVQSNLNKENILTFNGVMLQLLPVYTHANLSIRGAEWLENPLSELEKFICYVNQIYNCFDFIKYFKSYFNNYNNLDIKLYLDSLLYPEYHKKILFNKDKNDWSLRFYDFVENLMNKNYKNCKINYIIVDKTSAHFDYKNITSAKIFENDGFIIFKMSN